MDPIKKILEKSKFTKLFLYTYLFDSDSISYSMDFVSLSGSSYVVVCHFATNSARNSSQHPPRDQAGQFSEKDCPGGIGPARMS